MTTTRRVLLSTIGTLGDVIPFARLATALLRRGHAVTVQSWPQFEAWFPRDARFVAAAGEVDEHALHHGLDAALRAPSYIAQKQRFARMFYGLGDGTDRARAAYERARTALAGHELAVINVLDHATQLAADDVGVRWASYASRPPPPLVDADPVNAELDDALGDLFASVTGRARRVRMFRERSTMLALAACSRSLVPPWLELAGVDVTGAWLEPARAKGPLPPELDAFVAGGPCLFVTFGTMPDMHRRTAALIEAAATSDWRAVVQVLAPAELPATLPPGVFLLRERVAFDALVPRVAAVVHHGSVGTLHEVVRAGKPSLVVAHMGDQFFWARAVAERGLGPPGLQHATLTADALAERMTALREAAYAHQAAALAPVIAAEDGVQRAVERIEEVVA